MKPPIDQQTRITITKKRAIESHITSALELMFRFNSYPSAHVLMFAAWEMLDNLGKTNNTETSKTGMITSVKPEWQKRVHIGLNDVYNALKHADKDPHRDVSVNFEFKIFVALSTINDFRLIFNDKTLAMGFFEYWSHLRYPDVVLYKDNVIKSVGFLKMINNDIQNFALEPALELGRKGLEHAYGDASELGFVWPFAWSSMSPTLSSILTSP